MFVELASPSVDVTVKVCEAERSEVSLVEIWIVRPEVFEIQAKPVRAGLKVRVSVHVQAALPLVHAGTSNVYALVPMLKVYVEGDAGAVKGRQGFDITMAN